MTVNKQFLLFLLLALCSNTILAQKPADNPAVGDFGVGMVDDYQRISDLYGNFTGTLDDVDRFGCAVESLGDLNGDGIIDIAVGAHLDDDGGTDKGAVWILFMDTGRIVKSHYKINSDTLEAAGDTLNNGDRFGDALANVGDLNNDGIIDLAVASHLDDEGGTNAGAVYILFLDTNGHIKSSQKITEGVGGFMGGVEANDRFGVGIDGLGDFDGDGIEDLLVGAHLDDDGGSDRGAVYILLLDTNGTVKSHYKISEVPGIYLIGLDDSDHLGSDVASLGDVDGNGVTDFAAGAFKDDDGTTDAGAVWIFLMNSDGSVKKESKISRTTCVHLYKKLSSTEYFGISLAAMGDMNKDGVPDLAVGAINDDDGAFSNTGALWFLYLDENGKTKEVSKISKVMSNFHQWDTHIRTNDNFGMSIAALGDYSGNGAVDIVVGAYRDDDGGTDRGCIYVIEMDSMIEPRMFDGYVRIDEQTETFENIGSTQGLGNALTIFDSLGGAPNQQLVIGEQYIDDGGTDRGGFYIVYFSDSATVDSVKTISDTQGNFTGTLDNSDQFGHYIANIGDLNLDGVEDLAVGAIKDDDGATDAGAVWILFMTDSGTVKSHQKITENTGGFTENLQTKDYFGMRIASIGDVNRDSINDIAVGARLRDDGGSARGAIWILMMDTNGTVKSHQRISDTDGGFSTALQDVDQFGSSIASLGDLNGDSIPDIAVGALGDDDGGTDYGAIYVLFLDTNGTVKYERKINEPSGHFTSYGATGFGRSMTNIGDINYDGVPDLAVGESLTLLHTREGGFKVLLMDTSGYPIASQNINSAEGGLPLFLHYEEYFAANAIASIKIGGIPYIAAGATGTNGVTWPDRGSVYLLKGKKLVDKGPPFTPIFDTYGYAQLKKKLDGNYYHTQGANLRVQYSEDYYVSDIKNLTYTIYDEQWNTVTNTPAAPIDFGDNRLSLNLGNTGSYPGDFFILEVENDKNEKEYLRFKYK